MTLSWSFNLKAFGFFFIFTFFSHFGFEGFLALASADAVICPKQVTVAIQCEVATKEFQLISHVGTYNSPAYEEDPASGLMICNYSSDSWTSTYRYVDSISERIIRVSSLEDLSMVVQLVRQMGFPVEYFGDYASPFTMVTYKLKDPKRAPEQLYLFSGLESTFDEDNFSVAALETKKFSTVVINENYLKSQNAVADTFRTGNNCSVSMNRN